jgi:hypothetical protein
MTLAGDRVTMADQDIAFLNNIMIVSATRRCSERTTVRERRGSRCKNNKSTDRGVEKWFPGMLPKALRSVSLPKGIAILMMEMLCK